MQILLLTHYNQHDEEIKSKVSRRIISQCVLPPELLNDNYYINIFMYLHVLMRQHKHRITGVIMKKTLYFFCASK